ncbi:MAG: nickel pincer cofactor biosynthesis protein LarB, partial [Vicinamibacteria bacterium]
KTLRELLEQVERGTLGVPQALERLRGFPYEDLGFARIDTHRHLRQGFPEVVLGEGKTASQIAEIMEKLRVSGANLLATRVSAEKKDPILRAIPDALYDATSRTLRILQKKVEIQGRGTVLVVSAGTSDLPVAEEAVITAEIMGNRVERLYDVGVAGAHRILAERDRLARAGVLIVGAGMDAALASVVGGMVGVPVIAVPTSIGYGANFAGLSALLGMLNSCAAGVTVVNIDNGFGAAAAATRINRPDKPEDEESKDS